jgi:hypothetical protein
MTPAKASGSSALDGNAFELPRLRVSFAFEVGVILRRLNSFHSFYISIRYGNGG